MAALDGQQGGGGNRPWTAKVRNPETESARSVGDGHCAIIYVQGSGTARRSTANARLRALAPSISSHSAPNSAKISFAQRRSPACRPEVSLSRSVHAPHQRGRQQLLFACYRSSERRLCRRRRNTRSSLSRWRASTRKVRKVPLKRTSHARLPSRNYSVHSQTSEGCVF